MKVELELRAVRLRKPVVPSWRSVVIAAVVATLVGAGTPHSVAAADPEDLTFEKHVRPIIEARCIRCHGEEVQRVGLDLRSLESLSRGTDGGPIIHADSAEESVLYRVIAEGRMPPDDPLPQAEAESILRWLKGSGLDEVHAVLAKDETPAVVEHDILPILHYRCVACHGKRRREAGLDLRSREGILKGGKSGPAIVVGKPDESLLVQKIASEEMPPRKDQRRVSVRPVMDGELEQIKRWIKAEAPRSPPEYYTVPEGPDRLVTDEDRQFWAYRPPQKPPVPQVSAHELVRNPIDAFLLEKLESEGLSFSPEVNRETLLRRVHYDLTGLPPEPEDVEAFLNDPAPDAYEGLVDRLLDSPAYGERWAVHWLDAAGYAESEGRSRRYIPRKHTWRYRDYVIRSFNADKPYDEFLIEQLAGDELVEDYRNRTLTPEEADKLIATGLLRLAPDGTADERINFLTDRWEVIDGQLDVLGSAILATTISCARCHSHKFDPVPQRDYFSLAAIFGGAFDPLDWRHSGGRHLEVKVRDPGDDEPQTITIRALYELGGTPSPTHLHIRGNPLVPGQRVAPAPPAVFSDPDEPFVIERPWGDDDSRTGRRLAFARWLTRPDHPATSRVMVNRMWHHHFGRGIVETVENFGPRGARPTHPELLDWLAVEFVSRGWSLKSMHRLMVTSTAYRQSSVLHSELERADPPNQFFSRMPFRRLDAEAIRDGILKVTGRLDPARYGEPSPVSYDPSGGGLSRLEDNVVARPGERGERRSVYMSSHRLAVLTMLETFDKPQLAPNCLTRGESTVVQQALLLMNSDEVWNHARHFALRVADEAGSDDDAQVRRAWLLALSRPPAEEELRQAIGTLERLRAEWSEYLRSEDEAQESSEAARSDEAGFQALTGLCHALLNSAEFIYLD